MGKSIKQLLRVIAHLWSFPFHKTWRCVPEVERAAGGWELRVLKQLLLLDAFPLQLAVVLVLVRLGGGEHGEDSQLETDKRNRRTDRVFGCCWLVFQTRVHFNSSLTTTP